MLRLFILLIIAYLIITNYNSIVQGYVFIQNSLLTYNIYSLNIKIF